MKIKIFDDPMQMGFMAATEVKNQLNGKKDSVLILPTGSTPIPVYKNLVNMYNKGEVSFADAITFNLDEYIGIESDHEERYYNFMKRNLFSHVDIKEENINIPDSRTQDCEAECVKYEKKYRASGCADLALLGIGNNGHIGFNEPGTSFDSVTHVTHIAESTIKANSRFFASEDLVPKAAMTMGISTILSAKKIFILITGKAKHDILMKLISSNEADESIPATALRLHKDVTIYADREAAGLI
ncbi:MAG: glucosamine-6-phosphate deaminase [Clostridia bacterium]|nr:glucosamine-6-phosphate deaminase [Clostridia bacterium]